jgi:hypothetical protein
MAEENIAKPVFTPGAIQVSKPTPQVDTTPVTEKLQEVKSADAPETPAEPEGYDFKVFGEDYLTSPVFYEVAQYFDIKQEEYSEARQKLEEIVKHAQYMSQSNDWADVLHMIREFEDQIQPPSWGERRYTNLYKYIRLSSQRDHLNKALSAYERRPNE